MRTPATLRAAGVLNCGSTLAMTALWFDDMQSAEVVAPYRDGGSFVGAIHESPAWRRRTKRAREVAA